VSALARVGCVVLVCGELLGVCDSLTLTCSLLIALSFALRILFTGPHERWSNITQGMGVVSGSDPGSVSVCFLFFVSVSVRVVFLSGGGGRWGMGISKVLVREN